MKKSILSLGKSISKKEQQNINGGLTGSPFLGSRCYTSLGRCNSAMSSAINNAQINQTPLV